MDRALGLPVFVGKVGLCYPLLSDEAWKTGILFRGIRINLAKLLQSVICVCSVVVAVCTWISLSLETLSESSRLSDNILFWMEFSAAVLADAVIRLSTIFYWRHVTTLVADLRSLWCRCDFVDFLGSRTTKTYAFLGFLLCVAELSSSIFIIYKESKTASNSPLVNGGSKSSELQTLEFITRGVVASFDLLNSLSLVYAILFLTYFGPALLEVYIRMIGRFSQEFLTPPTSAEAFAGGGDDAVCLELYGGRARRLQCFRKEFGLLRKCFETYLKVAGGYSFALAFGSTVSVILALSTATGIANNSEFIQNADFLLYIGQILALVVIANFGTLLHDKVQVLENCECFISPSHESKFELKLRWIQLEMSLRIKGCQGVKLTKT